MGHRQDGRLSKKLSWLLRHGAVSAGVTVNDDGYMPLNEVLSVDGFEDFSVEDVLRVVNSNDKQRFSVFHSGNGAFIRANQGHSGEVALRIVPEKLLVRLTECDVTTSDFVCVHGTNFTAWKNIRKHGLSRMCRQMIHCAAGLPENDEVTSGMRRSCNVLIYVDVYRAIRDDIAFYKSDNNVLLTAGVENSGVLPSMYFRKVVRRDTGEILMSNECREERNDDDCLE